jgi:hypothetical protein
MSVRPGSYGKELFIRIPLRMDNRAFAGLFGYFGDLITRTATLVTKNQEVHDDFIKTLHSAIGAVKLSVKERGPYSLAYATTFIQHLFRVGGINTRTRQLEADNSAPLFLFAAPNSVIQSFLRSLFESEGGPDFSKKREMTISVDLHQAVLCVVGQERDKVPRHPGKVSFRKLSNQDRLLDTPSRLLISASLLLLRFGIESRLWPADLYMNDLGETVMRWRLMITGSDIGRFAKQIGFISTNKQQHLETRLKIFHFP